MSGSPVEVYRDRWLLVVDKPSGLPTQGTRGGDPGLYELLREREAYVGLHHRLDQPASGLVLLTVHPEANRAVARALGTGEIVRIYEVVLAGRAAPGEWSRPVEGRSARSTVVVAGHGSGLSAARVRLHTGRKHQIRVQAALAGTPVVGDRRYGGEAGRGWPRLALHASRLELAHPVSGVPLSFHAPLPADLEPLWIRATLRPPG